MPAFVIGCRGLGEGQAQAQPASPEVTSDGSCPRDARPNRGPPYYRAGAPEPGGNLLDAGLYGTVLELDGRVTGHACSVGQRDVELDIWQATADGRYDNDGSFGQIPPRFMLRGRVHTDAGGRYHIRTVVPGRYLNGAQYRPAHIHMKPFAARAFIR